MPQFFSQFLADIVIRLLIVLIERVGGPAFAQVVHAIEERAKRSGTLAATRSAAISLWQAFVLRIAGIEIASILKVPTVYAAAIAPFILYVVVCCGWWMALPVVLSSVSAAIRLLLPSQSASVAATGASIALILLSFLAIAFAQRAGSLISQSNSVWLRTFVTASGVAWLGSHLGWSLLVPVILCVPTGFLVLGVLDAMGAANTRARIRVGWLQERRDRRYFRRLA